MERFQAVLLGVWREACRHIEICQSAETITSMLLDDIPIGQLLVRRIDPGRRCLETVAVGLPGGEGPRLGQRTECSASQADELAAWCAQGRVFHRRGDKPPRVDLETLLPEPAEADLLAGPLGDPGGSLGGKGDSPGFADAKTGTVPGACGVLLLMAPPGQVFDPRHAALARALLDPFSVALANDRQLHELATLREAAEAERRSLLTRLGRKALADTIVGADTGLHAVMQRVELVARSDAPVLIFGETGAGKELVARAIHQRSPRRNGPIHRVNCGAIPPELIDSELFGHERGAFTGAVETRKGWFERADGGSLFLDEIGELPPAAQVRLLRILQDGWFERVGGQQPIHVDVRIIAATHGDLASMVAEGRFREDLWYRVAVFPIFLPPLRERRQDIGAMAAHFAERAATRFGLPLLMPSAGDVELLQSYAWPGNVRELATVIDRAAILGNGTRLEIGRALGVGVNPFASSPSGSTAPRPGRPAPSAEIAPLDVAVRQHIEAALTQTKGRIEGPRGAARLLRINPHTLRAKMRKLGIEWAQFRSPDAP